MTTTVNIPMTVTSASDRSAGCRATTRAPMPMNMMRADRTTAFLKERRILFPVAYSYISPSVMKMV